MPSEFDARGENWWHPERSLDPDNEELKQLELRELEAVSEVVQGFMASIARSTSNYSRYPEGSGLSVEGTNIDAALVDGYSKELHGHSGPQGQNGHSRLEGSAQVAEGAMLRLNDHFENNWIGLATLPGYEAVATVREINPKEEFPGLIGAGSAAEAWSPWWSVDQVAYLPLPDTPAKVKGEELAGCIAQVSAEIQLGTFDPNFLPSLAPMALWEDLNPTLAVLFAHEWSNIGRVDQINRLIQKFEAGKRPIPFDLPLLVGKPWERVDTTVVPGFPLLMRGWAIAESIPADEGIFKEAVKRRVPSIWASFHNLPEYTAEGLAAATTHPRARAYA